ncbi:putative uncharacterized domain protein [Pseudarthrobacter siccitolerans]|uniref:Uncharacterized domain protein n=1 Tax=Pseudarthrobacter siccitolerans TaxID=861266 RepID=A0A024GXU5_9MICC|nr:hypothetical protein [Pseudarthrobacter siccitolerans]CCQ44301.1 putative uncharacterized domain protein [Pseudarthrobacter siccitolerans]
MNNATRSLADISADASGQISASLSAPDNQRTENLKAAARALVEGREHFYTREGEPDWLGRTYAYRTWVREIMSKAHVPGDEVTNLQAAIRYHSGNVLRDRLSGEQIESLGLKKASPRERSVEQRERAAETLNYFAGGPEITEVADIQNICKLIETALHRVNAATIKGMPAKARREAKAALLRVAERAEELAGG